MNPRLKKLFDAFPKNRIDGLLVSSWPNVTYLSGFKGTESWAFVSPKGLYLITDSRYAEEAREEAKGFHVVLRDKRGVAEIVKDLAGKGRVRRIGFEAGIVTYDFYRRLAKTAGAKRLTATRGLVEELRVVKDAFETAQIRKSAELAVRGYHYIRKAIRPGMSERDAQGRLEYYTKTLGSEKPAFDLIIASGARSSMPHCRSDETPIRKGGLVLVDMGVVYGGYHSDLTRPVFLGKMTSFQKKIHDLVWHAQRLGIEKAGPGVPAKEVDRVCRKVIEQGGHGDFFGHGTGHGVGLEIHEAPTVSSRSETLLKPGMVITVEPGIYLPGRFGIRIEDMVLITEKGREVLTKGLERERR
ncbi:MAG: aminopeptidase P family protein [Candidatus Omnitrophica bacterium]|nr:aminopeptidase P family protein [Candidatus Omnitrophota bacterium]